MLIVSVQAMVYAKPKRIAITGGYHGSHMSLEVYKLSKDNGIPVIGIDDEFQEGDLCWLESPLNPTGEARCVSTVEKSTLCSCNFSTEISNITLIRYAIRIVVNTEIE